MKLKIFSIGIAVVTILLLAGYGSFRFAINKHNSEKLSEMGRNQTTFETFIKRVHQETTYTVYITSGYRSTEHQRRLYEEDDRNAKPGTSPHEFKRALDINLLSITGRIRKADSKETWMKTGIPQIAKEMGLRWGGNFKYYHDPVHFEVRKRK